MKKNEATNNKFPEITTIIYNSSCWQLTSKEGRILCINVESVKAAMHGRI